MRWPPAWAKLVVSLACLASWTELVVGSTSESLCLPTGIVLNERRFLPSAGGGEMPVGILAGAWPSSELLSELVMILIKEVVGFHAQVDERDGEYGGAAIYALAGCINFNAPTDRRCGEEETRIHVSTDSWVGGYDADFKHMLQMFPEIAPQDLGSIGYDGEEGMFVSDAVFNRAYTQGSLILDHHRGYNRSHYNAKMFFDSLADIQLSELKECADSELNNHIRMEIYASYSGDLDGVATVEGGRVAKCPNGYWWISPACREDVTECIPLITGGLGWRIQALMQWSAAYSLPVAVAVARDFSSYVQIIATRRVLFYWWVPDSTFVQMHPHMIQTPRHNPREWARGDKKTSMQTTYISNLVSADLNEKAPEVRSLMINVRFFLLDLQDMLLRVDSGSSIQEVACRWIQDNVETWSEWIVPTVTNCLEGFGLVDNQGKFVDNWTIASGSGCAICSPGSHSEPVAGDFAGRTFLCSPCQPGYSQASAYSTKCEPCPMGTASDKFSSTACVPCGLGEYQPLEAQQVCLPCNGTRTTQLLGSTSRQACVCKKDFIEDMDLQCTPCPEGVLCPVGSTLAKLLNSSGAPEDPRIEVGSFQYQRS